MKSRGVVQPAVGTFRMSYLCPCTYIITYQVKDGCYAKGCTTIWSRPSEIECYIQTIKVLLDTSKTKLY